MLAAMRHGVSQRGLALILSSYNIDRGLATREDQRLLVDHSKEKREGWVRSAQTSRRILKKPNTKSDYMSLFDIIWVHESITWTALSKHFSLSHSSCSPGHHCSSCTFSACSSCPWRGNNHNVIIIFIPAVMCMVPFLFTLEESIYESDNIIPHGSPIPLGQVLRHSISRETSLLARKCLSLGLAEESIRLLFKLPVVCLLTPEKVDAVKSSLLFEITEQAVLDTLEDSSPDEDEEDDFFKSPGPTVTKGTNPTRLSNKMGKELEGWCSEKQRNKQLEQAMFPVLSRAAWVDVFVKYNTAIRSSADVDKLFSQWSDIMKAKRASLTSDSFERLVFMKGNMDLLKMKLSPGESE
ncbi:hypothetical protein GWK47_040004 [Chionoecetes opilio]|uniref:Uncharacterized protein n=1 Tax=Chionoecetes opilio TaxID=41210 RepID=A0A8J4YB40_CHIOP|nr:hypothetical protein GWK47_040004 [Chionoecetes opilio]